MTRDSLVIGFVPLLDCATLVAAVEQGFAAAEDLELALVRENSWANIRDRLIVGHLHAAHMLGPMTVASTLGIGHMQVPMVAPIALGLGGNAITVSAHLWKGMEQHGARLGGSPQIQGQALRETVKQRAVAGLPPLTFAMVYPFSCHNYELRYWLAACGIDLDRDVHLTVIPPPFLADALKQGQVDGFCVGEPWNSLAVEAAAGVIVTMTTALWPLSPEKVLGCRASWASEHPEQLARLIRAVYKSAQWCDQPENHAQLARMLAQPRYIGVSAEVLEQSLAGRIRFAPNAQRVGVADHMMFSRHLATFPWTSHALWFYSQMLRWKQCEPAQHNFDAARAAYRPDLYRTALQSLHAEVPAADYKTEEFFDGRIFDPAQPIRG